MRVLVTWGSKHGGTEEIGRVIGKALVSKGFDVVTASVDEVEALDAFDGVVVGGALYANRWPANVRRFVQRNFARLRRVPVWFFSSGPLDHSADRDNIPATGQVSVLAERVGARGHVTFGGRLEADVKGFPASAMAKEHSGDYRNFHLIHAWASAIGTALPNARPGRALEHPARSVRRLLAHGFIGWAACTATMVALLEFASLTAALVVHAIAAPLVFTLIAWHYFGAHGARDPLPTAFVFTAMVALLDLVVVAGVAQRSLEMFTSIAGTWLPFTLIFGATWGTGALMSTMPWPKSVTTEEQTTAHA